MPADEGARWTSYKRVLTRAAMFAAAGVLSWWFGLSPAAAEQEDAAAHDGTDVAVSADDAAHGVSTASDATAESDLETVEAHASAAPTSQVVGVTTPAPLDSVVVAKDAAPPVLERTAEPLLVPVLDATLPPVLVPVLRPVGTTVDAIVAPVVSPVRDTVVTPIFDGVSESVVTPLNEAVIPFLTAVVEPAMLSTVDIGPAIAAAPLEAAAAQNVSTDVDTAPPLIHEVKAETRKAPRQPSRADVPAREDTGQDSAQPSSAGPHPGDDAPVKRSSPPQSTGRSASSGTNGEQVERSQRGLLTARAAAPVATPSTNARIRATVAGASQNSGSRPAFTPD